MDILVDVYYYDYILKKIIEMYKSETSNASISHYLRIATEFSRRFRKERLMMDKEIYLKELYLKVIQTIKAVEKKNTAEPKLDSSEDIFTAISCLNLSVNGFPSLAEDKDYQLLNAVVLALYKQRPVEEFTVKSMAVDESIAGLGVEEKQMLEELLRDFSYEKMIERMGVIQFGNPVMKKFVGFVQDSIDKENKEKKNIVGSSSPGAKVSW